MNVTKLNRSGLNVSRLNASLLNAIGIGAMGCKGKATMEDKIMDSMVLWYDLAKQGATNESMAADPRIIDHSGNGHHATCYNFAWSGMSGIGGCYFDAFHNMANDTYNFYTNQSKSFVHITSVNSNGHWLYLRSVAVGEKIDYKIRITGLDALRDNYPNCDVVVSNTTGNASFAENYRSDGEYEFSAIVQEGDYTYVGLGVYDTFQKITYPFDCNITIEQLPLYPHALVSDGVDDYVRTYNLPILNDYTLFFNKKFTNTLASGTFILSDGSYNSDYTLGYTYDTYPNHSEDYFHFDSFGYHNEIGDYIQSLDIITPTSFNDHKITRGSGIASRTMLSVGSPYSSCPMAFYGLIVFNRTLSDSEIEWVKTNLITNGQ